MTIHIVDLESIETRYTCEWKEHVPQLLRSHGLNVNVIDGPDDIPQTVTPGAFLNFGGTNVYKAKQVEKIGRMVCNGEVKNGDYFLFTDAWHPGIINLKYMIDLLSLDVKIGALWHAGSYDPADFLGRLIGDAPWVRHAEQSFFHAIDHNYFATDFHIDMFCSVFKYSSDFLKHTNKVVRTGWPMDYMPKILSPYKGMIKEDIVLFPHRIAPEKNVDLFRALRDKMPEYQFIICQEKQLTKKEYHELLGKSKIVFSASFQETLGIGCYEGVVVDAIPFVPDRLSYREMYYKELTHPSFRSETLTSSNIDFYTIWIRNLMRDYDSIKQSGILEKQANFLTNNFFSADNMIKTIKGE